MYVYDLMLANIFYLYWYNNNNNFEKEKLLLLAPLRYIRKVSSYFNLIWFQDFCGGKGENSPCLTFYFVSCFQDFVKDCFHYFHHKFLKIGKNANNVVFFVLLVKSILIEFIFWKTTNYPLMVCLLRENVCWFLFSLLITKVSPRFFSSNICLDNSGNTFIFIFIVFTV